MAQTHFVCWNVNGIRAMVKKDFLKDLKTMNADVLCFQETKASAEDVKDVLQLIPGYYGFSNSSKARKGYSGTAIFSKEEPLNVTYDLGFEDHDMEGRVITAEFLTYFLVTVYTPNSGDGLKRLDYRETWDEAFREHIVSLKRRKPVIVCGDLNVAHKEIDIARPKENYNKSAGYTQREIDGFQKLLDEGFIDTFRHFKPTEVKYTYWNNLFNSRARNVGWRIDYFLVPENMVSKVKKADIYTEYMGSDHCPIALTVDI
ncbi:MAG: exodeoxyribonuclease III [Cyclobacteriaceae bacterium]|nr:exodeoxyribonuclease III [Cyclobacteriaceae bacterium]